MDNNINQLPDEIPAVLARDIYLDSKKDCEAIREALSRMTTPTDVLVEIGEVIPFCDLQELAPMLVSHPNFSDETLDRIVGELKISWWGDDPIQCRIAWETLERERAAHLRKVEEMFQMPSPPTD